MGCENCLSVEHEAHASDETAPRIFLGLIGRRLPVNGAPIITIVGKAFWDIGHAPSDQSNTRKRLPDYPVRQIYPVMN